jgi:hypothetical protein
MMNPRGQCIDASRRTFSERGAQRLFDRARQVANSDRVEEGPIRQQLLAAIDIGKTLALGENFALELGAFDVRQSSTSALKLRSASLLGTSKQQSAKCGCRSSDRWREASSKGQANA